MKRFWRSLELEWKMAIAAALLLLAFALPVQKTYVSRLRSVLAQSSDTHLEPLLRSCFPLVDENGQKKIIAAIERHRQWRAMVPIIITEQRTTILLLSFAVAGVLLAFSIWSLKRLTKPLKDLAHAAESIGKGDSPRINNRSGGALGRLECSMQHMQQELGHFRERAEVHGMEQAWRDIARVMAHEIKNPLTPIRLSLDQLEEKQTLGTTISPEMLERYTCRITTQVDNLERLVDAFRSFAREPEVNLRPLWLHGCISECVQSMSTTIDTNINGDAQIEGDPYLFSQIIINIWKNAHEAGATKIDVGIVIIDKIVHVKVTDNGPGIDTTLLEKIWVPYVTFKKGGTGLGLPVVRRLIESMGGHVHLTSLQDETNHGLTFHIQFKICPKDSIANTVIPATSNIE
jgi:nitrogen fixation/metabolism regulation signal transduction histidine kinase